MTENGLRYPTPGPKRTVSTIVEIGGAALVIAGCAAGVLAAPRTRARTTPSPVFSHPSTDSNTKAQVGAGSAAEND